MDTEIMVHIFTMDYYSAIKKKKDTFKSVLMTWMNLEPITQSEVWYFIIASDNQGRLLMTLDLHYCRS